MTLTELKEQLKNISLDGIYSRPEFDKFAFGGESIECPGVRAVFATLNYGCEGAYGPHQKVTVMGLLLTVYPDQTNRQKSVVVTDIDAIEKFIESTKVLALSQCAHTNAKQLT